MDYAIDREDRMWATFCHLAGLLSLTGIPFAGLIGPLVIWLLKKDHSAFIDDQGREAVNFQISMGLYMLVAGFLVILLVGIPLLMGLVLAEIILILIACARSNEGGSYRYPLTLRFL